MPSKSKGFKIPVINSHNMSEHSVPPGKEFYFKTHDNRIVAIARSLEEFRDLLSELQTEAVLFHLRDNRNDFESWVRGAVKDDSLADRIKAIKELDDNPEMIKTKLCQAVNEKLEA